MPLMPKRSHLVWCCILPLLACDRDDKPPPPIERVPKSDPGTESSGPDASSSTGDQESAGTTVGEAPTCDDFQVCAVTCTDIEHSGDIAETRQVCADLCEPPEADQAYEPWFSDWAMACATADLTDQFPDSAAQCAERLEACEVITNKE